MRDKTLECSRTKPPKRWKNDAKDQKTRWRKTGAGSVVPSKRGTGRVGTKEHLGVKFACRPVQLDHTQGCGAPNSPMNRLGQRGEGQRTGSRSM